MRIVLDTLLQHSLLANHKKCIFGQAHVDYLGYIISAEGVAKDPIKTEAHRKWSSPVNIKYLRGFLVLTGYYKRFLKSYELSWEPKFTTSIFVNRKKVRKP
ncbi:hypothetical protein N665_0249s0006 [Sinapis alba]|nr:hypothetical protein N665_0249s0006 [Sinapis alba]KAF8099165.1 hypothetical protein N665_0249s0006 [Sinapis alba]